MKEFLDAINYISAILSIAAAFYTLFLSRQVKKVKEEIYAKSRISNYTELEISHQATVHQVKLITTGDKIGRGVNVNDIFNLLQSHLEIINKHKSELHNDGFPDIKRFTELFKKLLVEFNNTDKSDYTKLKEISLKVYFHLIENFENFRESKRKL